MNRYPPIQYSLQVPFGQVLLSLHDGALSIKLAAKAVAISEPIEASGHPLLEIVIPTLRHYFEDAMSEIYINNYLPIETLKGTPYQKRVWEAIANIPAGQVQSYADIANTIHSCPRAVANACGANTLPILIPCHRVVAKSGLGGFMRSEKDGLMIKKWLLKHEGIVYE